MMQKQDDSDRDLFGKPASPSIDLEESEYLLALHFEYPSGLAIKVSETGEESRAFVLPTAKIRIAPTTSFAQCQVGAKKLPIIKVHVPGWMAREKGLI